MTRMKRSCKLIAYVTAVMAVVVSVVTIPIHGSKPVVVQDPFIRCPLNFVVLA